MTTQKAFDKLERLIGRKLLVETKQGREMAVVDQIDPTSGPRTRCVLVFAGDHGRQCFRSVAEVTPLPTYAAAEVALQSATAGNAGGG